MANIVGALRNIGVALESTAGTAAAITHWIPIASGKAVPVTEYVEDESNWGRLEAPVDSDVVSENTQIDFSAPVRCDWFGVILASLLGEPSSAETETGVYAHTYTVTNSPVHTPMTVDHDDGTTDESATYALPTALSLNCTAKGVLTADCTIIGRALASDAETPSYSSFQKLLGSGGAIKLASDISGFSGASVVNFHEVKLDIDPNILIHHAFGSNTLNKTLTQSLRISGELKILRDGNTYRDYVTDGTNRAMQIKFTGGTKIGVTEYPYLQINLAKVSFESYDVSEGNRDAVIETLGFTAQFDADESTPQQVGVVLQNTEDGTNYSTS